MLTFFTLGLPGMTDPLLRLTLPGLLMLLLVTGLGALLLRYSSRYMAGEPHMKAFRLQMLGVLLAVALVILSDHLLLLLIGWMLVGSCLHPLLVFYPERPFAVLAAHKKFLLTRLSDCLLLIAILLLWQSHGSFSVSRILDSYQAQGTTGNPLDTAAAVLIALTALLRSAQLPFHGWLIQTVEAPTPVSALLHAGVINLGGFLLILFAPLLAGTPLAQWVLLLVAGPSLLLAALIMSVRASVKVRLAWSTSAQMSLMLIECALGLYELALLHLLAHSLYKAHAFLRSGEQVNDQTLQWLAPAAPLRTRDIALACLATLLLCLTAVSFSAGQGPLAPWAWLGLAVFGLLIERRSLQQHDAVGYRLLAAVALVTCFSLLKWLVEALPLIDPLPIATRLGVADLLVALLFGGLFAIASLLRFQPRQPIVRTLARHLYAGLYVDELITRLTLRLWPVHLPQPQQAAPPRPLATAHLKETTP